MLTRWRIEPSPTKKDPKRRVLLLQAALSDVQKLIRSFGAACGRPKREKAGGDYNFSVALHGLDARELAGLEAELKAACPPPEPPAPPTPPAPPSYSEAAPPAEPAKAAASTEPPSPEPAAQADLTVLFEDAGPPPEPAPEEPAPVEPVPEPAKAAAPAEPPPPPSTFQGAAGHAVYQAPAGDQSPRRKDSPPTPAWTPALQALAEVPFCGVALELSGLQTFETLLVGAYNRFAHAAAMSVVTSPGGMYNPLFISGSPAGGKTHLLHAIGRKLQESSNGPIILTSGPRLALSASVALHAGKQAELERAAAESKALLIDDMHLLGVNEQNQEALCKFLGSYFKASKQVVIVSAYAPKLLAALEDALGFKIAEGHAVEVKLPDANAQRDVVAQMLESSGFEADEVGRGTFMDRVGRDFTQLTASLRRLHAVKALRDSLGQASSVKELLEAVFAPEKVEPPPASPDELVRALPASAPPEPPDARAAALFYPAGQEAYADWAWFELRRAADRQGWPFPLRLALRRAYDPLQVFGVPFLIADECQRAGAAAALVLGPTLGTELAAKEGDFRYALEHLLGAIPARLGWVRQSHVKSPTGYTLAFLDMLQEGS